MAPSMGVASQSCVLIYTEKENEKKGWPEEYCIHMTSGYIVQKLELLHYEFIFHMAAHENPQDGSGEPVIT